MGSNSILPQQLFLQKQLIDTGMSSSRNGSEQTKRFCFESVIKLFRLCFRIVLSWSFSQDMERWPSSLQDEKSDTLLCIQILRMMTPLCLNVLTMQRKSLLEWSTHPRNQQESLKKTRIQQRLPLNNTLLAKTHYSALNKALKSHQVNYSLRELSNPLQQKLWLRWGRTRGTGTMWQSIDNL